MDAHAVFKLSRGVRVSPSAIHNAGHSIVIYCEEGFFQGSWPLRRAKKVLGRPDITRVELHDPEEWASSSTMSLVVAFDLKLNQIHEL